MTVRNGKHSSSATDPCRKWTYDGRANRKYVPLFDVENLIHEYSQHHLVKHFETRFRARRQGRKGADEEKLFTMRTIPTSCGPGHHSGRHKTLAAWMSVALVLLLFIHRCDAESNKICKLSPSFSFYFRLLHFSLILCVFPHFILSHALDIPRSAYESSGSFIFIMRLKRSRLVSRTDFSRFGSHSFRALSSANSLPPFSRRLDK